MTYCQGQISAQGILHLRNPNVGPNSAGQILQDNFWASEIWTRILGSSVLILLFPAKEAPPKNIHPPETHLPKFTFQNSTQKSGPKIHIAPWAPKLPISVNGAFPFQGPFLMGRFQPLIGRFPECLNGPFSLFKVPWKTAHQEKGH